MHYIFDTYAWVEYFIGSKKGLKAKKILDNAKNIITTPENCISEMKLWCLTQKEDFRKLFTIIKINSEINQINLNNWIDAANIRHEKRKQMKDFGLMDAIIIAKQNEINGRIVTGDPHFKNLPNTEFL